MTIIADIKQLFNKDITSLTRNAKIILNVFYVIIGLDIWINLYSAQFQQYDDNLATVFSAFGISALVFTLLTTFGFKRKHWFQDNLNATIIFFLTCSPITVALVIFNYSTIFGHMLDG